MELEENKGKITFIDLFAETGGFHLAIKGIVKDSECAFASEIDDKCMRFIEKTLTIKEKY